MAGLQRLGKRNTGVVAMTSYGDIIKQGRTENSKEVNTEVGKAVKTNRDDRPVNITIEVPRKSRQYWTSQCKLQGVTMTEVLVEALIERFGEPESG